MPDPTPGDRLWRALQTHVLDAPGGPTLVNPYTYEDPALDMDGAAQIRRENIRASALTLTAPPEALIVAEAPGPWGCRFSGVPLVSEQQLLDPDFPLDGRATSLRALHGEPLKEYSGGIYWRQMLPRWGRFWTWNAVPFHPHKPDEPLTIRAPRVREIRQFAAALAAVVEAVQPGRVIALGRVAERALTAVGVESTYVRHPSQGGATLFREGTDKLFGV